MADPTICTDRNFEPDLLIGAEYYDIICNGCTEMVDDTLCKKTTKLGVMFSGTPK